jgi:programmed cell death protein 5
MPDENRDEELEELRKRKLLELQLQQRQQEAMQEQATVVEQQKQMILRQILSPEAKSRLSRIKLTYPEFATSVEEQLILLAQSGKIQKIITDDDLKMILNKIQPKKHEISIQRR